MEFLTFDELQEQIQAYYRDKDYAAALELATQQAPNFPEQFQILYYWQICMSARTNQVDLALQLMDELIENGFWYAETLLRKSPSLQSLQGRPAFEERVEHSRQMQDEERSQLYPLLVLRSTGRCGSGQETCPLIIALHANASTAQQSLDFWQPAAGAGWLVAVPQSSQSMWKGAYVWDDLEISEAALRSHYQSLIKQYSVDPKRVVIAGHSMGGALAAWLAVKSILPAAGFIAIGPGGSLMDDLQPWTEALQKIHPKRMRGYFILGDEDTTISSENTHRLVSLLNKDRIRTEIEEIPDAGHDFAPEYGEALLRGLNFIVER